MLEDASKLWWDEITGPANLVKAIVASLQEANSVLLSVPGDLSWRKHMRNCVENMLRESYPDLSVHHVDCRKECPYIEDVPRFLLERFAEPAVRDGYRVSSGLTEHEYLLNSQALHNRVIWVKGMESEQTQIWYDFCRKYQGSTRYHGTFVIEASAEPYVNAGERLRHLKFQDYVSYYDALLFNNMVISAWPYSAEWKQYLAALASQLCDCDVELSELYLRHEKITSMEPIKLLGAIANRQERASGREDQQLASSHPFSLIQQGNHKEMSQKVWKAQLQTLFPLIEFERLAFLDRHHAEVQNALNTLYWDDKKKEAVRITQAGEILQDPYDAEVGTLCQLQVLRKAEDHKQYMLFCHLRETGNVSCCSETCVTRSHIFRPAIWKS